jgi:hypothetical protein
VRELRLLVRKNIDRGTCVAPQAGSQLCLALPFRAETQQDVGSEHSHIACLGSLVIGTQPEIRAEAAASLVFGCSPQELRPL